MLVRAMSVIAGALIVAGCAPKVDDARPPQPPPAPKDRDVRAVVTALRHLDACALIEPGATPPTAGGPHRCATVLAEDADRITVTLGIRFDHQHKYAALPMDLGGSKAYLDVSEPGTDTCQVAIPVSFEQTIAVVGRKGPRSGAGDICEPTKSGAAAVVRRLANSSTGSASNWTACELLAAAVGHSTGLSNDGPTGLDACVASEQGTSRYRINLDYGDDPTMGALEVRNIAGQRMVVRSDNSGCSYLWRAGPNPVVSFHATDCAPGEALLPKLITALTMPNRERASPQSPLLMRLDEPDEPLAAACVDYPYGGSCQPGAGGTVPQGAQQILNAATGDARVACAFAADAVHTGFGTTMTPVLGSRTGERPRCYFVEPSHTTVIEVSVRPDGALADAGGSDSTVAGRPARSASGKDSRSLCLLPVSGAKTGLLCVIANFLPGRGKETDSPVDTGKGALVEPAVTSIVSRYFS